MEHLTVTTFEIEHIIPVSADEETSLANLCLRFLSSIHRKRLGLIILPGVPIRPSLWG